jgi:ribonucleoside-triphosphate reductase
LGVSASHLDWTMVPYVRKSFLKHYKDGMEFIMNKEWDVDDIKSIDDELYKENLQVYNYAIKKTERELNQAVEGMFHNLN